MRVFVIGASGYIGSAVAKAFARAGHKVIGLVRSESSAKELQKNEIQPHIGDMGKIATFEKQAKEAQAIIHCAFDASGDAGQKDHALMEALAHLPTPKILVYTSGVWVYGNRTHTVDETTPLAPLNISKWRLAGEEKVLKSPHKSIVIRPGHVYGYGKGLVAMLFEAASKGSLTIPGHGENHWSIVHVEDLAQLYLLAVEKELSHTILNATENSSIKLKDLAEGIAKRAETKVHYIPYPEALKHFGPLAEGLAVDQPKVSNDRAARLLGWYPRHSHLLPELTHYWFTWKAN